jgi:hypothetical protein
MIQGSLIVELDFRGSPAETLSHAFEEVNGV